MIVYDICRQIYTLSIFQIIADDDLIALVSDELFQPQVVWKLEDVQVSISVPYSCLGSSLVCSYILHEQVTCGTLGLSTATVKLIGADGDEHIACSVGTGPVDAAYKAVDLIVKV